MSSPPTLGARSCGRTAQLAHPLAAAVSEVLGVLAETSIEHDLVMALTLHRLEPAGTIFIAAGPSTQLWRQSRYGLRCFRDEAEVWEVWSVPSQGLVQCFSIGPLVIVVTDGPDHEPGDTLASGNVGL